MGRDTTQRWTDRTVIRTDATVHHAPLRSDATELVCSAKWMSYCEAIAEEWLEILQFHGAWFRRISTTVNYPLRILISLPISDLLCPVITNFRGPITFQVSTSRSLVFVLLALTSWKFFLCLALHSGPCRKKDRLQCVMLHFHLLITGNESHGLVKQGSTLNQF